MASPEMQGGEYRWPNGLETNVTEAEELGAGGQEPGRTGTVGGSSEVSERGKARKQKATRRDSVV